MSDALAELETQAPTLRTTNLQSADLGLIRCSSDSHIRQVPAAAAQIMRPDPTLEAKVASTQGRPLCWPCLAWQITSSPTLEWLLYPPYGHNREDVQSSRSRKCIVRWRDYADRSALCAGAYHVGRRAYASLFTSPHNETARRFLSDPRPLCWACFATDWPTLCEAEGILHVRPCLPTDADWQNSEERYLRSLPTETLRSMAARGDALAARLVREGE